MHFVSIREAVLSESAQLAALARQTYADAFGASMSAFDLHAHLEKNLSDVRVQEWLAQDIVLVAEMPTRYIGYVQFGNLKENAHAQELRRLYVLSDFQKQGIGTRLLQTALAHPQMQNAAYIELDVWEHNHGARQLYERFGFQVTGKRTFEVASGAASDYDLIMRRLRDRV